MRYAVAGLTAFIVTSVQLRSQHARWPFGSLWAMAWWFVLGAIDGLVAAGAIWFASSTGHQSAGNLAGWVSIGVLAPLGLRSPIKKEREILGRPVSPGLTTVYDTARTAADILLDEHLAELRIRNRSRHIDEIMGRGWTYGTILVHFDDHLVHKERYNSAQRMGAFQAIAMALEAEDERTRIGVVVEQISTLRLTALLKHLRTSSPTEGEAERAHRYLERARQSVAVADRVFESIEASGDVALDDGELLDVPPDPPT